jgi:signal transduction histidine kinase
MSERELHTERIKRQKAEQELAEAIAARQNIEAELERVESLKSRFAAALRHEFGQPLTVIQGFSELIAGGGLSAAEMQEYAAEIHKEATHLAEIIAQIRSMDQKVEQYTAARRPA